MYTDDPTYPLLKPESMYAPDTAIFGPSLKDTSNVATGAPSTETPDCGVGTERQLVDRTGQERALIQGAGSAVITVLVPGYPLLGPMPKTPSMECRSNRAGTRSPNWA